jgi:hypothetical protein
MSSNIKDVARRAGVSIATVSHVINNTHFVSPEKKHRVLSAIEGLNYRPNASARSLRSQKASQVDIFVCELYAAKNPRLLLKALGSFIDAIEGRSYQAALHFVSPRSILTVLEDRPDCIFSLLITDSAEAYAYLDFAVLKIFLLNMDKAQVALLNRENHREYRYHYGGHFYFTALANHISDDLEENFCFFMTWEELNILRELYAGNVNYGRIFTRIRVINSEMSAAQVELADALGNNSYEHIYLTDYKFALGAIRLLLLKPELVHTRTGITFFNYDSNFENFGFFIKEKPFFLSKTDADEIIAHAKDAWA